MSKYVDPASAFYNFPPPVNNTEGNKEITKKPLLKWAQISLFVCSLLMGIFGGLGTLAHFHLLPNFISLPNNLNWGLLGGSAGSFIGFIVLTVLSKCHSSKPKTPKLISEKKDDVSPEPVPPKPEQTTEPVSPGLSGSASPISSAPTASKSEEEKIMEAAEKKLKEAWEQLKNISQHIPLSKQNDKKPNFEAAKKLLESREIGAFILLPTVKSLDLDHPNVTLSTRIESIRSYIQGIELNEQRYLYSLNPSYELPVQDNGDCLFEGFSVFALEKNPDTSLKDAKTARAKAIEWIKGGNLLSKEEVKEPYIDDPWMQYYLLHSMYEHYESLFTRARKVNPAGFGDWKKLEEIDKEKAAVYDMHLSHITPAFIAIEEMLFECGKRKESPSGKLTISKELYEIINLYLNEMSQDGLYGGGAELYALCQIENVSAQVFRKIGKTSIEKNPFMIINPQRTHTFLFTNDGTHYNPYKKETPQVT